MARTEFVEGQPPSEEEINILRGVVDEADLRKLSPGEKSLLAAAAKQVNSRYRAWELEGCPGKFYVRTVEDDSFVGGGISIKVDQAVVSYQLLRRETLPYGKPAVPLIVWTVPLASKCIAAGDILSDNSEKPYLMEYSGTLFFAPNERLNKLNFLGMRSISSGQESLLTYERLMKAGLRLVVHFGEIQEAAENQTGS